MGTSVQMVARYFDILMSSTWVSIRSRNFPFSWSVCVSSSSMLPNWLMSFLAVTSPTPGQPG